MSLIIVKGNSIVYCKGFGWADKPKNIKATPNTVYHWWSVTKIATAIAILQLQEKGRLQLDDSVSKYLPFFKVEYPSKNCNVVTINHLLNHSSGIPDAGFFTLIKWIHHEGEPSLNQTDFLKKVLPKYSHLKFEPGENTSYTNIGYMVLGAIIEKVTNISYEDYVRQNILEPLEMKHTDFVYTKEMQPFEAAGSHPLINVFSPFLLFMAKTVRETSDGNIWMERVYNDQTPSSALIGSVDDAAHLAIMYLNHGTYKGKRILSEHSVDIMTNENHVAKKNDKVSYFRRQGIGWQIYKADVGYKLEHTGGGPGFFTVMQVYPEKNLSVIMFCNSFIPGFASKSWKITKMISELGW